MFIKSTNCHNRMKAYVPGKKAVEFSERNYSKIEKKEGKVFFVDGGNAELVTTPNYALQFVRVAVVGFEGKKRVSVEKREAYVEINMKFVEGIPHYTTKLLPVGDIWKDFSLEMKAYDKTLSEGGRIVQPGRVVDVVRRFLEIQTATEVSSKNTDCVIVLDGTLDATVTGEKELLEKLYAGNNRIAALAKTNTLLTEEGKSFVHFLFEKGPGEAWIYYPTVEDAQMVFCKLHSKAKHVFRVDVQRKEDVDEVMSVLAMTANDITFPGYPYGLIVTDRLARVSNQEAEYLKVKAVSQRQDVNAVNAHAILDGM